MLIKRQLGEFERLLDEIRSEKLDKYSFSTATNLNFVIRKQDLRNYTVRIKRAANKLLL